MNLSLTKEQRDTLDINEVCALCECASPLREDEFLCRHHGVVDGSYSCKKFCYDLLKRKPRKQVTLPDIDLPSLDLDEA